MNCPAISIIIPTYNRARSLAMTIQGFDALDYPKDRYEIVVADNNSSDETRSVVDECRGKSSVPIQYLMERRQGVHYARNTAAKQAKYDLLYFTDDDMTPDRQLLRPLVSVLELDAKIACAGGRVLPIWEIPPPDWIVRYCSNGLLSLSNRPESLIISPLDPGVFSCHQLIRKKALIHVGGFNPENTRGEWIGDGETGLNLKLEKSGYWFAYVGASVIHHRIPAQRLTLKYLTRRYANQGSSDAYTAYRAHGHSRNRVWLDIGACVLRAVKALVLLLKRSALFDARWRLAFGRLYYSRARLRYDVRLLHSARWRDLVRQNDWMAEIKNPGSDPALM